MTMRTLLSAFAVLALTTVLALPCPAEAKTVMRFSHAGTQTDDFHVGVEQFVSTLEKATNGDVQIKLFINGVLGPDRVITEMVQQGTLDFSLIGQSQLNLFIPTLVAMDFPFVVDAAKNQQFLEAFSYKNGPLYKYVDDAAQKIGLKLIMTLDSGYRSYAFAKGKNVPTLDAMKGVKVRTTMSPVEMAFANAMGMNPSPLPWTEVYTALQQGTVEGEIINITSVAVQNRAEVEGSMLLTRHSQARLFAFMNRDRFLSFPPKIQEAILEAGDHGQRMAWVKTQETEAMGREYCKANNFKLIELSDADKAELQERVKPVYEKFSDGVDPAFIQLMKDAQK